MIKSAYCNHCKKMVKIENKPTSHVLHLLLTIITGGAWLIIWFWVAMFNKNKSWRCLECGNPVNPDKYEFKHGYCKHCQKEVQVRHIKKSEFRVLVDWLLCMLTCGLYVLFLYWLSGKRKWYCCDCGKEAEPYGFFEEIKRNINAAIAGEE